MTTDKGKKKERGQTKKQISKEDVVVVVVVVISLLAFRRNVVRSRLTMVRPWRDREDARIRTKKRERERVSDERKSHKGRCTYRAYK